MTVILGPWPNSTQIKDEGYPYSIRIDDLLCSGRAYKGMSWNRTRTVGELIKKTPQDLLRVPSFGHKSLCEVEEILDGLGIAWGRKAGRSER